MVAILTFFKIRGPSEAWEPGPVVLPAKYDTSAYRGVCRTPWPLPDRVWAELIDRPQGRSLL